MASKVYDIEKMLITPGLQALPEDLKLGLQAVLNEWHNLSFDGDSVELSYMLADDSTVSAIRFTFTAVLVKPTPTMLDSGVVSTLSA